MNTRFRPNTSPSLPPSSSSPPNASAYAVTIHWRESLEKPRACWADGRAMFTIVASRTTISWASPMTARIIQRCSWWGFSAGFMEQLLGVNGEVFSTFRGHGSTQVEETSPH